MRADVHNKLCIQPVALLDIVAANVTRFRERRGYSQDQLGRLVGVHRNTIMNLEARKFKGLRTQTLEDIANALGVEVKDLILPAEEILPAEVQASLDAFLASDSAENVVQEEREKLQRAALGAKWGPLTSKGWMFALEAMRSRKSGGSK